LYEQAPLARLVLVLIGGSGLLFGWQVGRAQTDIKSSQACATTAQIGLMFIECGLGLWQLAAWHLGAHAVLRCWSFLRSPSILHNARELPLQPVAAPRPWLRAAALQQFWLDPLLDWTLLRPVQRLARDIAWFENRVLDP